MALDIDVDVIPNTFLELILRCPLDQLEKLFHHLVDVFCGQQTSLFNSYSDVYKIFDWCRLKDQSETFFKEYFFQEDNVISEKLESLPSEYTDIIKDVLEVRENDLKSELIERTHKVSPAYLKSFDWKVKMTLGSDKMSQVIEPKLILDLDISADKDKSLQLDLSKEEVKTLLDAMEKAKTTVYKFMQDD